MKVEISKLITGSRDKIFSHVPAGPNSNISILKNLTYEKLNQHIEDLLKEHNY